MKAKNITDLIEKTAPLGLQYEWDNSGFLCGDINQEVKKVYITLDVNKYTVDEAIKAGADMIISHHPIMFRGINKVDYASPEGYVLNKLIKHDIALYASHTPMDTAQGGINDVLAEKIGIENISIIEENIKYPGCGLGRIGDIKEPMTLKKLAEMVKIQLNTPFVRICGNPDTVIKRVAVGGGACDNLIPSAKNMGADVMITADMKYHISIDSVENGICVIDAGHYPTEVYVIDIFEKILENCEIDIVKSSENDIFAVI